MLRHVIFLLNKLFEGSHLVLLVVFLVTLVPYLHYAFGVAKKQEFLHPAHAKNLHSPEVNAGCYFFGATDQFDSYELRYRSKSLQMPSQVIPSRFVPDFDHHFLD